MHGLVNRLIEEFLRARYGESLWREVAVACEVDPRGFHAMRMHPPQRTRQLMTTAASEIGVNVGDLSEDVGAWLVQLEPVRRLLRFSGRDYTEFLLALDQLPGRAEMVVPKLGLPALTVIEDGGDSFVVDINGAPGLWAYMLAGLLRQMADDYGALALITVDKARGGIVVDVPDQDFAHGRSFDLVAEVGGRSRVGSVGALP
ncbi:heme NO-binding domain-containing protein [uncultured Paracoccus sp.]|uniref:heme NO-binding domain-containing protein n=1 Tax=uncultured Paracoccus sp. TaxID=189685 RepID=UPI00261B1F6B|nr:heme NO-binding domain-containing protein [uncultured Paracoccus sp.]